MSEHVGTTPASHPQPQLSAPPALSHLGIGTYVTIIGFSFVVLRIFAVSGYDWDTAFLVSSTLSLSDSLNLLFGSLMAEHVLVTILLALILPLMTATYLWGPPGRRSKMALPCALGLVLLIALTISFKLWWLPVASAAILGLFALIRMRPKVSLLHRSTTAVLARVGLLAGLAVLLTAALAQTPWVPLEEIETTTSSFKAYVLSVDSGFVNILTEDREFQVLLSSDVIARK